MYFFLCLSGGLPSPQRKESWYPELRDFYNTSIRLAVSGLRLIPYPRAICEIYPPSKLGIYFFPAPLSLKI